MSTNSAVFFRLYFGPLIKHETESNLLLSFRWSLALLEEPDKTSLFRLERRVQVVIMDKGFPVDSAGSDAIRGKASSLEHSITKTTE
jgi:hypothetical protein